MKLTILVKEGANGFLVGKIKEIPAVLTQGKTLEELKENLIDALELYFEDLREESPQEDEGVISEEDLILAY
jgi:predicted RNase H-like HicB family nuclease